MQHLLQALRAQPTQDRPEAHRHICTPAGDEIMTMSTATGDVLLAFELGAIPADSIPVDCHMTAECAPITRLANLLPEEIGSNVPLPVNGGAEHLMSLPLREAREIFEREYLLAQINRFGGNISRTAEFIGMERSALHRKLKSLGV